MQPLLSIRSLYKEFRTETFAGGGNLRAVDGVDLDIYPGETVGLVGESGCGKTTLARCALRLLEPDSGSVEFEGIDLGSLPPHELRQKRREFQIIFQDPFASLDPRMNVLQILSEPYEVQGLGTRRNRQEWTLELLRAVSLDPGIADRVPSHLSGGQQQRVAIARAIALKPKLIIADEPVSALDASVQAQILNLLLDLQKQYGLTLLLISHSLAVIHHLCNRIAVMYLGRIVEEAPADSFFPLPKHPYSRALLESMPSMDLSSRMRRSGAPGEIPSASAPPPGCHFHPRCPDVMQQCREVYPDLEHLGRNWKVACHLYCPESE